jgi:G3E family GTPase
LDGLVALVDAVNGAATLDNHPEALKQAAVADRLVFSKTDLLDSEEKKQLFAELRQRLHAMNPTARLLTTEASLGASELLDAGLYDPATKSPDVRRWLNAEALAEASDDGVEACGVCGDHHHHEHGHHEHGDNSRQTKPPSRHDEAIRSFCLIRDQALSPSACGLFLEMLRSAHGPDLLRVKGIIGLSDDPNRPLVIHGVQHIFHPPVQLDAWPDADRRTRIVFIAQNLQPAFVEGLYAAFSGEVRMDAPDAAALVDNPLAPRADGLLR